LHTTGAQQTGAQQTGFTQQTGAGQQTGAQTGTITLTGLHTTGAQQAGAQQAGGHALATPATSTTPSSTNNMDFFINKHSFLKGSSSGAHRKGCNTNPIFVQLPFGYTRTYA